MNERNEDGDGVVDTPATEPETRWSQVAQRCYRPGGNRELTTTIVFAIAAASDVSPEEVKSPPLYESVDVPAIEAAFFGSDSSGESRDGTGAVTFRYAEYRIEVRSDGWVFVSEPAEPEPS
ncbi:HalOD1 output domain-containing protein [Halomicroarcula sp. GCM10025709]|uniref:HalOD1 output domain-containing protein n=1 Tax=Haloarcula TaxID=2237 RepID=UPI0024C28E0C|nr:HalOD1 output domain-containing protein [Halomicroarcula sp. YJ-61-S]